MDVFVDNLLAYRLPVHLALDGARVVNLGGADIAERLAKHGLVGRPLFRETAHRPTVLAGPWLISLGTDRSMLERGTRLAREVGKGVFWLGEPDSEVLFRHLRKLGAASMPDGRMLYFRHYDPDVLAAIVPLVDEKQAAHLFGPTYVIAFIGGCGDGATVAKPNELPEPSKGPIAFEAWQISLLDDRQTNLSHRKIAAMLRESFREKTASLSDTELDHLVKEIDKEASSYGVTSESAHAKWAFLYLLFSHKDSRKIYLRDNLLGPKPASANDSVEQGFEALVRKNFEHNRPKEENLI